MAISFCSASCMIYSHAFGRSIPCSQYVTKPFPEREKGAAGLEARLATLAFLAALERQLKCKLYQTRIARALDSSEIASVREVPVRLKELRVVESVEQFAAKLQFEALAERRNLEEGDLPIVDSRSAANGPRRVTYGAGRHSILRERAGIESQVPRSARIEFLEWRRDIWLPRSL